MKSIYFFSHFSTIKIVTSTWSQMIKAWLNLKTVICSFVHFTNSLHTCIFTSFLFVLFGVGRGTLAYSDHPLTMAITNMKRLYITVTYFHNNLTGSFFSVLKRRYLCISVMHLNPDGFFLSPKAWVELALFIICNAYWSPPCKLEQYWICFTFAGLHYNYHSWLKMTQLFWERSLI